MTGLDTIIGIDLGTTSLAAVWRDGAATLIPEPSAPCRPRPRSAWATTPPPWSGQEPKLRAQFLASPAAISAEAQSMKLRTRGESCRASR